MNTQSDQQLLQAYAASRSEPAFAELVRRHIDLVYSAALRRIGDPHLAQDVTQGTFAALAQNARSLTGHPVLSGWLHRTTQNIAANLVRSNIRRQVREQEAITMNELLSAAPDASWQTIASHLDAALDGLDVAERDAVMLRYFEKKSASEMAVQLGISDEAAQKRVSRAVDRLREFFAKRGVTVGASGLAVVISANAVQAAPVGLALTISTATALTGTALASTATIAATKTIATTALLKTVVAMVLAVAVGIGIYKALQISTHPIQQQQISLNDRSTPKGTMLVMAEAMETGDSKTYLECFVFVTDDETKLKPSIVALLSATARFNQAISNKFGAEAAHSVFPNMPFAIPTNDIIKSAHETIEGDTATVSIGGKGGRPIRFTKINSEWKMAADGFVHLSPAVMRDIYARVIKALDQTTPEIAKDKFKTAMEAVDKMKERAR